jgi:hypothetical protein
MKSRLSMLAREFTWEAFDTCGRGHVVQVPARNQGGQFGGLPVEI